MVQINKSELKEIRKGLVAEFPLIEQIVDDLLPQKGIVFKMRLKSNGKADLIIVNEEIICFIYNKHYIPSLKIFHKCELSRPAAVQGDAGG